LVLEFVFAGIFGSPEATVVFRQWLFNKPRDASKFINLTLTHEGFVTYGDNNKRRILGRGDVGDKVIMVIKDVLLVEGRKHSLSSISQLCDKGYNITFEPGLCYIFYVAIRKVLPVGKMVKCVHVEYLLHCIKRRLLIV